MGEWTKLPNSESGTLAEEGKTFAPNAFLNDHEVVGQICAQRKCLEVGVAKIDGQIVSRHPVPRSLGYKDGQYFAAQVFHESDLSRWWDSDMDMWAFDYNYFLYIWETNAAEPVAKIKAGNSEGRYCPVDGEPLRIALVDGENLRVVSVNSRRSLVSPSVSLSKGCCRRQ